MKIACDLDRDAVERFRVEKPVARPNPQRLIETSWQSGEKMYFAAKEVNFMLHAGMRGEIPFYKEGARTRLYPDDGSEAWKALYAKALEGPMRRSD